MTVFKKNTDGQLTLIPLGDGGVAPSMEECRTYLGDASKKRIFNQLVLIGSANDIAWAQALLCDEVAKLIVAEINYPLMPGWFRGSPSMENLQHALEHVFRS